MPVAASHGLGFFFIMGPYGALDARNVIPHLDRLFQQGVESVVVTREVSIARALHGFRMGVRRRAFPPIFLPRG